MALATAAAAAAGTAAAAAYLDAKFHIKKDLTILLHLKAAEKDIIENGKQNKYSLWYKYEDQVKRMPPSEPCIWSRSGCYNWAETYALSCQYAQFFLSLGIEPGQLVGFYLQNHPEFMISTLASWGIGTAPALINYNLGGEGLIHCLKISGAKVLLVDEDDGCRARIEESRSQIENELGMRIVVLDATTKSHIKTLPPTRPARKYRANVAGTFPMCLMYTSGSTGFPKACPFQVQRAVGLSGPRLKALGLKQGPDGDRYYICMPMYHGTGFTSAVSCMLGGLTLCVGKKFSGSRFWNDVRDSDATAFVYVGETARYLLANPPSEKDRQHRVKLMFGNGMRPDVWHKFVERFGIETVSEFFNSTEGVFGLLNVSRGPFLESAVGHHGGILRFLQRNTIVPVKVDHETETIWRDPETGFAVRNSYEEGGEIIVQVPGEAAFSGYWKNEKATDKKFERDVFKKGDLYYRTGDALRRLPDGRWYFMDRLGDTYRWKSENVATAEVSEVLGRYPGVVEATVYGVLVPGHDGRAGCAAIFIDPQSQSSFDYDAFYKYAQSKLPKYAVPVFLRVMSAMNPMHNNKQNKVPLKKDGIDVEKVEATKDRMMWCPTAVSNQSKKDGWVAFTKEDLEGLKASASVSTPRL